MRIEQNPGQQAWFIARLPVGSVDTVLGENGLHIVPKRLVDDGLENLSLDQFKPRAQHLPLVPRCRRDPAILSVTVSQRGPRILSTQADAEVGKPLPSAKSAQPNLSHQWGKPPKS
jgi:hypothetical protein